MEPEISSLRRWHSESLGFIERDEDATIEEDIKIKAGVPTQPLATLPDRLHAALCQWLSDTYTISILALKLWKHLPLIGTWAINFWRLVLFSFLLMPGFFQMGLFYFFSPRLIRSIPYGPKPRQRLDVYFPRRHWRTTSRPIVIYITGGAWVIGYKAWGALFGRRLSQRGVLVFCLDYRNFPQGSAEDMLEDVNTGIKWILDQAELYGGDLSSVFVVGQSAGGHLSSLALLSQAQHQALVKNNNVSTNNGNGSNGNIIVGGPTNLLDSSGGNNVSNNNGNGSSNNEEEDGEHQQQEGRDEKQAESVSDDIDSAKQESFKTKALLDGRPNWNINKIKGFVVVSGTYDLVSLSDHLHKRGLYKPMLQAIHSLHGKPALAYLSPTYHLANNHYHPDAVAALPPTVILHGTADKSVPIDNARQFYKVAKAAGMDVELIEWPGYSHTEPIVEGPMRGGRDEFMDRVLSLINGREEVNYQFAMCPAILIKFATAVCPF